MYHDMSALSGVELMAVPRPLPGKEAALPEGEQTSVEKAAEQMPALPQSGGVNEKGRQAEHEEQALAQLVGEINEQAQVVQRQLEFTVDEVTNRTIIRVKNAETGEMIREIPPEELNHIARSLRENSSNVLFNGQV